MAFIRSAEIQLCKKNHWLASMASLTVFWLLLVARGSDYSPGLDPPFKFVLVEQLATIQNGQSTQCDWETLTCNPAFGLANLMPVPDVLPSMPSPRLGISRLLAPGRDGAKLPSIVETGGDEGGAGGDDGGASDFPRFIAVVLDWVVNIIFRNGH